MSLLTSTEDFLWRIAIKKAAARGVQMAAAFIASRLFVELGVEVPQEVVAAAVMAKLEILRNYLKIKKGWDWIP